MKTTILKLVIALFAGSLLLWGCAEAPLKVQTISKNEHPSVLANKLNSDLSAAKEAQVDALSPTWFSRAQSSYIKARDGLKQGGNLSVILDSIAMANAQLKQAQKYAENSRYHLKGAIKSRNAALKAGADRFGKDYAKVEGKFLDMTESVEDNNIKSAVSKKKSVDLEYRALELRAIKHNALSDVRQMIRKAEDENAHKTSPKSFSLAKQKLTTAENFITKNRYAVDDIAAKSREAKFYAQRMNQITQTSLKVEDMEPEDISLWVENYLHSSSSQLKGADRRNISFDAQQKGILGDIAAIKGNRSASAAQLEAKSAQITKLNQRIADLEGRTYQERADKERLAAEKKFNELYNKVQGYFTDDAAEVYKKGHQCVIRLKAIKFPVGQSVIVSSNYPVLKTVQRAINTFGRPDVIIEGHTDSTGSAAVNKRLSQSRAESVRQYFLANGSLPANKLNAIGYGSSRPLASNKSAAGRAINRRIDVLIKPYMK